LVLRGGIASIALVFGAALSATAGVLVERWAPHACRGFAKDHNPGHQLVYNGIIVRQTRG
jgi:hypothetical protein